MARRRPGQTREAGQDERGGGTLAAYSLDIDIDEKAGRLRIYDPRAFHAGRRRFCRRLLEIAAEHPGLEKAEVDVAASVCVLSFDRGSATARSMSDVAADAVRRASAEGSRPDQARWWSLPARWSALTVYRSPGGDSWWETLASRPGRVQLRHSAPVDDGDRLPRLAEALGTLEGIKSTRASARSRTLTLDYRRGATTPAFLLDVVEQVLQDGEPARSSRRAIARRGREAGANSGAIEVATGYRRLKYLALAGGSFAMTVIGLVIPGIPTVPFLLATSYYLARSSPRLNDRLRRTALFGPILGEWEEFHGLSRASKAKLVGLTAAIIAVTVVLGAASPVALLIILIVAMVSVYGIVRLPGLPHEGESLVTAGAIARKAPA